MMLKAEDSVNELQQQMEGFAWSISDHRKSLEMSRRLQQAMEEVRNTSTSLSTFTSAPPGSSSHVPLLVPVLV